MTVASPGRLSNATKVESPRAHRNHNHAGTAGASLCVKAHPLMTSAVRTRAAKAAGEKEGDEGERDEVVHADTAGERLQTTKRMGGSLNEGESAALTKGGPRELSAL